MRTFTLTLGLTVAATIAGGVLAATPAQAASTGTHIVHLCVDTAVEGNPGQTLTVIDSCTGTGTLGVVIVNADTVNKVVLDIGGLLYAPGGPSPTQLTFTLGAVGTSTLDCVSGDSCPTVAVTVHDPVVKTVSYPEFIAHDYLQQVGMPASGNCADVSPKVGHWLGAPAGGWTKSWARWINGGRGGPVCTREILEEPTGFRLL
jgi:hypothetical protein